MPTPRPLGVPIDATRNLPAMDVTSMVERAVAAVEPGGRLVDARALTGGVSADVVGVEVVTADGHGRRFVVRRHRDVEFKDHGPSVAAKEHRLLGALHRRGLAVPEPYAYVTTDA